MAREDDGSTDSTAAKDAAEDDTGQTHAQRSYSRWRSLGADERSPRGQAGVLAEEIAAIDGTPMLHFVHVILPHLPFHLSRTGVATSYDPEPVANPNAPGYAFWARLRFQVHSMQLGAADALVGELIDHLRALPTWDQTLLVVTSDHGSNHTPPNLGRRTVTDANREEMFRVPLFVKVPGQVGGDVRDESAMTIDVLPSIADLVDAEVDWQFDGHSLFDGSAAHTAPGVSRDVEDVLAIAARRASQFPHGDDWTALAAVGANGDLVGRRVADVAIGPASEYRASLDQEELLSDLPTPDGKMPFVLVGKVAPPNGSRDEPPELLAAVNGTLAGVVGGYRRAGESWKFLGYVADFYRDGANEVELYEVTREQAMPTLHLVQRSG